MNELAFHAYPLLQIVCRFEQISNLNKNFLIVRNDIVEKFITMEQALINANSSQENIDHVKYCLAAIIDECVLCSCWEQRQQWMGSSLQTQWFGEHLAGREFFSRLTRLLDDVDSNIDVIELYYLALQLGFKGKYRLQEGDQLQRLIHQIQYQLAMHHKEINERTSVTIEEGSLKSRLQAMLISCKGILVATVTVNILIYCIFSVALNGQLQSLNRYFQTELINNLGVR